MINIDEIYQLAQSNFNQELKTQINENLYQINEFLANIKNQTRKFLKFLIFQLDINQDTSINIAQIVQDLLSLEHPQVVILTEDTELAENQIVILDAPASQSNGLIAQISSKQLINLTIITISPSLPTIVQTDLYCALAAFYEQQNYFPIAEFHSFTFQGSFKFNDVVKALLEFTALSEQFLSYSINLPLYQAQFYANDLKQSLGQKELYKSEMQCQIFKFLERVEEESIIMINKIQYLIFLEKNELNFNLEQVVSGNSGMCDFNNLYNEVFGEKIPCQNNISAILKYFKKHYQNSETSLRFENFGEVNFQNKVIQQLLIKDRSKLGILFKCIQNMTFETPIYDILNHFNDIEGTRFSDKTALLQEFEEMISYFIELNIVDVEYRKNVVLLIRRF